MIYLIENEVGFDPQRIGFPSISGCHAIVYSTSIGLFGYHSYGGVDAVQWPGRARCFNQFVTFPIFPARTGYRLYGVTYVDGQHSRGWRAELGKPKDAWTTELAAYASALGFRGKIRGYNLSKTINATSSYVEFRRNGEKCEIWVRPWVKNEETKETCFDINYHGYIIPGAHPALEGRLGQPVVVAIGNTALSRVDASRLRG
jgi:hypothetical protein